MPPNNKTSRVLIMGAAGFTEVGEPGLGSLVETFLVERGIWKQ